MDEFDLIRRYFKRDDPIAGVDVGIGDDGAVLTPVASRQQVQVIDTLVEGVHFPVGTHAADIAYRAVAVNLSDIAAMGAIPRWMTLALTLQKSDEDWIEAFAEGLFGIAYKFGVALVGGDTTRGPATTVTVSISGDVASGAALLRSGACAGDGIYVTGTLGDASAGLQCLQSGEPDEALVARFLRPTPRVEAGLALAEVASAAIDVSDGLLGDLAKLLDASRVAGQIDIETVPLSDAIQSRFTPVEQQRFALTGGDDYELCFTARPDAVSSAAGNARITRIGQVTEGSGLSCRLHGDIVDVDRNGYRHFE